MAPWVRAPPRPARLSSTTKHRKSRERRDASKSALGSIRPSAWLAARVGSGLERRLTVFASKSTALTAHDDNTLTS